MSNIKSVGILGAGIAGLSCANQLAAAGVRVELVDKSRGVGGRMATRRNDQGDSFDHGAQYFTVHSDLFRQSINAAIKHGSAARWDGRIVSLKAGEVSETTASTERFVGTPGMTAIAKSWAADHKIHTGFRVQSTSYMGKQWSLGDSTGNQTGPFDAVVSTAPPTQAIEIFGALSAPLKESLSQVVMAPCWAVMVQFQEPLPVEFAGAFVENSPLGWIANNSSKPGRTASNCWVLHATPTWSRDHLEIDPEEAAGKLVAAFWEATALNEQAITFCRAHRWRYSLPEVPLPASFLFDETLNLGACGDWCNGPRVEGAWLSGAAMAKRLLAV